MQFKQLALVIILCCLSCQSKPADNVRILVNKAQGTVAIGGLSRITLGGINRDSLSLAAWQSLFPVCAMPADTELHNYQLPLPGRYTVTDSTLVFRPDTPFIPGQSYFARYYRYDKPVGMADLLLHRRTLGQGTYTELIFKY